MIDAYGVLGVGPGASQQQLKSAHRALVRRLHPDLVPADQRAEATRRIQEVNVAYGLVRDPARRAEYDRVRAGGDAAAWDAVVRSAGRWAGPWWRRHRASLGRRAVAARVAGQRTTTAARRAGVDVLGRVLWLVVVVFAGLGGWLLAAGAQRLVGVDGVLTPLVATLGGLAVGNHRGWQLRLRLAGAATSAAAGRVAAATWVAGVALALWVETALR